MNPRRRLFERDVFPWLGPGGLARSLCGGHCRRSGVLHPRSAGDVQRIVYAAAKAAGAVKLQPVSCGRNWGFGSDLASEEDAYLLDLSDLQRIRALDLRGHCVELEPGVTQGQLHRVLSRHGDSHYFNVTGAGLGASIIGNALERGIGYFGQRHLDLLDLEVVLPSGSLVRTSRLPSDSTNRWHLGGLGPDPTGLFCQSNFGIVTAATIALHRRPELMGGVACHLSSAGALADLVAAISDLLAEGACDGVPHFFNRERMLSTLSPHLSKSAAAQLRSNSAPWSVLVPIRGSRAVFAALARQLEEILGPLGQIQVLGDNDNPKIGSLLQGRPSDFALASVAYSVFGNASLSAPTLEETGAGLIHVTPALPLLGAVVAEAEKLTYEVLGRHGYGVVPLSLSALSARAAALIVSIGFDRRSREKTKVARSAAADLVKAYERSGLIPYRLGLEQADLLPQMDHPWPKVLREIRGVFDPMGCMARSRYEPLWDRPGNHTLEFSHGENEKEAEEACRL